jgi:hypothetical protein
VLEALILGGDQLCTRILRIGRNASKPLGQNDDVLNVNPGDTSCNHSGVKMLAQ